MERGTRGRAVLQLLKARRQQMGRLCGESGRPALVSPERPKRSGLVIWVVGKLQGLRGHQKSPRMPSKRERRDVGGESGVPAEALDRQGPAGAMEVAVDGLGGWQRSAGSS